MAVLASGVDVHYPRGHDQLFCRLLEDGLLRLGGAAGLRAVPQPVPDPQPGDRSTDPGTVVVEAALRSGSLATAREARDLGRVVMGVPGPVTSIMSAGVHRMLREGALLVSSVEEVVEAVGELGADLAPRGEGRSDPRDGLDPVARRVLDALPTRRVADPGAISAGAGVDPATTMATLGLSSSPASSPVTPPAGAWSAPPDDTTPRTLTP